MINDPLSVITLAPIAVGMALLILPKLVDSAEGLARASRAISMGVSLAMLAITTMVFLGEIGNVDWTNYGSGYSLTNDSFLLIPSIGVSWKVGIDALSFPMVWLTTLLIPISMLVEWDAKRGHLFHPLILVMEGALIGVFVSLDMFVFYVFWELTLVPMFFLIMVWGGEDRRYASLKFFIYTFTASVVMLVGILVMYLYTPDVAGSGTITGHTFDLGVMVSSASGIPSEGLRHLVWIMLLILSLIHI